MFTGIIEETGTVKSIDSQKLVIFARKVLEGTSLGYSIAVNGTCLTVTEMNSNTFSVDIMPETLRRTSLGNLKIGDVVNLERALAIGGRLGGHFVQGHVDGTGKVLSLNPEGNAVLMKLSASSDVIRYIVEKGFITVEGASLTVAMYDSKSFTVSLVGFTREHTNLGNKRIGEYECTKIDCQRFLKKLEDILKHFMQIKCCG